MWFEVRHTLGQFSCSIVVFWSWFPPTLMPGKTLGKRWVDVNTHNLMCYILLTSHAPSKHHWMSLRSLQTLNKVTYASKKSTLTWLGVQKWLLCTKLAECSVPQPCLKQQPRTMEFQQPCISFLRCLCLRYPSLSFACLVVA